jgi:hypothetical protein
MRLIRLEDPCAVISAHRERPMNGVATNHAMFMLYIDVSCARSVSLTSDADSYMQKFINILDSKE